MCQKCQDTGRIVKQVGSILMFGPCGCEASQRNLLNFEANMKALREKMHAKFKEIS